jgi:hypothetical protein
MEHEDRRCANCANWIPTHAETKTQKAPPSQDGECHRYAPRATIADHDAPKTPATLWPITNGNDVCGEWYYGGPRLRPQIPHEQAAPISGTLQPEPIGKTQHDS